MVKRTIYEGYILTIAGLLLFFASVCAQETEKVVKEMQKVVIRPRDNSRLSVNTSRIDIDSTTVTVKDGETVSELLKENGIHSNVSSLGVVYELNPTIPSVDEIKPGDTLVIPKVSDPDSIEQGEGYLVSLYASPEQKKALSGNLQEIKRLSTQLDQNLEVKAIVESINKSFEILGSERAIRSEEMSEQLFAQSTLARELLTKAASDVRLTKEEQETLNEINEDWIVKRTNTSHGNNPNILVRVKTVRDKDVGLVEEGGFRIWRASRGIHKRYPERNRNFPKLSSPTDDDVPCGVYIFWAEKNNKLVSEELAVNVDKKNTSNVLDIDLEIKDNE